MKQSERIDIVEKFIISLKEQREEIVNILMWEICKNKADAYKEFDRTIEFGVCWSFVYLSKCSNTLVSQTSFVF